MRGAALAGVASVGVTSTAGLAPAVGVTGAAGSTSTVDSTVSRCPTDAAAVRATGFFADVDFAAGFRVVFGVVAAVFFAVEPAAAFLAAVDFAAGFFAAAAVEGCCVFVGGSGSFVTPLTYQAAPSDASSASRKVTKLNL